MEFYNCYVSESAKKYVNEVMNNRYLNQGPLVKKLENDILPKIVGNNCLTVNSCTSSLHLALELSNVRGKEVILPAKTFIATGMAVLMAGGIPVFADTVPCGTYISISDVIRKITDKTAAIIGVSWGGDVQIVPFLVAIKRAFPHIKVIEDAAHSFGSECSLRSELDFICYSFQSIKTLTCADGGLLVCKYDDDFRKAKAMRWFGVDKDKMIFSDIGERIYSIDTIGYKYNMNDFNAAMLLGNIEDLQKIMTARIIHRCRYISNFPKDITVVPHSMGSSNWLFTILVDERDDAIKALRSRGVPATKLDSRIDGNAIFNCKSILPNTQSFDEREINLPIHESLSSEDIDLVIESVKKGW